MADIAAVSKQIQAHKIFLKRRRQAEEADVEYPRARTVKDILEATEPVRMGKRLRLGQRARDRYRA